MKSLIESARSVLSESDPVFKFSVGDAVKVDGAGKGKIAQLGKGDSKTGKGYRPIYVVDIDGKKSVFDEDELSKI